MLGQLAVSLAVEEGGSVEKRTRIPWRLAERGARKSYARGLDSAESETERLYTRKKSRGPWH